MWEDLVKKGLAKRLGPDSDYIPPTTPPKNGRWSINSGYALNEFIEHSFNTDGTYKNNTYSITPNDNCKYCPFNNTSHCLK
jgi:hypothetical protein